MEFSKKLRKYRERIGLSQNSLAKEIQVDASYINRLENGDREPSRNVVLNIIGQLKLADFERDDLLLAAGFAPEIAERVDLTSPGLRLMVEMWDENDPEINLLVEQLIASIKQRKRPKIGDDPT